MVMVPTTNSITDRPVPGGSFRVQLIPGRGFGCICTKKIHKHEIVLEENPVIRVSTSESKAEFERWKTENPTEALKTDDLSQLEFDAKGRVVEKKYQLLLEKSKSKPEYTKQLATVLLYLAANSDELDPVNEEDVRALYEKIISSSADTTFKKCHNLCENEDDFFDVTDTGRRVWQCHDKFEHDVGEDGEPHKHILEHGPKTPSKNTCSVAGTPSTRDGGDTPNENDTPNEKISADESTASKSESTEMAGRKTAFGVFLSNAYAYRPNRDREQGCNTGTSSGKTSGNSSPSGNSGESRSSKRKDGTQDNSIVNAGLYPLIAKFNHSCAANVGFEHPYGWTMRVYAIRDIEVGEEICTCYNFEENFKKTKARQKFYLKNHGFFCRCKACEPQTKMMLKKSDGRREQLAELQNEIEESVRRKNDDGNATSLAAKGKKKRKNDGPDPFVVLNNIEVYLDLLEKENLHHQHEIVEYVALAHEICEDLYGEEDSKTLKWARICYESSVGCYGLETRSTLEWKKKAGL